MLIAYIDESYDRDRGGYWMAAVIVSEDRLDGYWSDLLECAHSVEPSVPKGVELHGSDIFGRVGSFAGLSPASRIEIYFRGLQTIADHSCRVVTSAHIPPSGRPTLRNWRMTVLASLIPQIEQEAHAQGQRVVLVCDEEHSTASHVVEMLHKGKVGGVHSSPILETAMFARSVNSPGVWPADLVAFLERRSTLDYGDTPAVRRTIRHQRAVYERHRGTRVVLTHPI